MLILRLVVKIIDFFKMFIDNNQCNLIGCGVQLNYNANGKINENHTLIANKLSNEVNRLINNQKIVGLDVVDVEIPSNPFRLIEITQNNYVYGYIANGIKINENFAWCGINHIQQTIPVNISSFLSFLQNYITSIANIENISRIGIVQTYKTSLSNLQINKIVSLQNEFNLRDFILEKAISYNGINAICRIVVKTLGVESQVDIDIVIEENMTLQNAITSLQSISALIIPDQPFNLFQIIRNSNEHTN